MVEQIGVLKLHVNAEHTQMSNSNRLMLSREMCEKLGLLTPAFPVDENARGPKEPYELI